MGKLIAFHSYWQFITEIISKWGKLTNLKNHPLELLMTPEDVNSKNNKPSSRENNRKKSAQEAREVQEAVHVMKDVYIRNVYDAIRNFRPRFRKNVIIKACRILWQDNPRRIADLDKDFPPKSK